MRIHSGPQGDRAARLTASASLWLIDAGATMGRRDEYADRWAGQLSQGTKQKVHVARAMISDPPVLLLDEPTAGLDVTSSRAVEEFILEAKGQGKTIVFSSHIMSQVEKVCDRVAIIHQGSILVEGTMSDLKGHQAAARFEDVFVRLLGEGSR